VPERYRKARESKRTPLTARRTKNSRAKRMIGTA